MFPLPLSEKLNRRTQKEENKNAENAINKDAAELMRDGNNLNQTSRAR